MAKAKGQIRFGGLILNLEDYMVVTPSPAGETGMVPYNFRIQSDFPEGDIDLDSLEPVAVLGKDDDSYDYDQMMRRATELRAVGSLGLMAEIYKLEAEGRFVLPEQSRGSHGFLFPLTELKVTYGLRGLAMLEWKEVEKRWMPEIIWENQRFLRGVRFLVRKPA